MRRSRWFQGLHSLGLEFWLPLPLLGLAFWLGSGLLTERMLSSSYDSTTQLKANTQLEGQPSKTVLSIEVAIKTGQGYSKVRVKTAHSALKEMEFEFPIVEITQLEAAIGRELGLSVEQVRMLVHYQVYDRGNTTLQ